MNFKAFELNNLAFGAYGLYANRMEFLNGIVDWCIKHPDADWSDVYKAFSIDKHELGGWEIEYIVREVEARC